MRNLELKARCSSLEPVLERALALGAHDHGVFEQVDTYYAVRGARLKVREMPGFDAQLIHYRRPDRAESRASDFEVVPVAAEHAPRLHRILAGVLGVRVRVVKRRRLLTYRHTRIHLDRVEDLGAYVELETLLVEGLSEEDAWIEHHEVRRALGLEGLRLVAKSYADLLLRRRTKQARAREGDHPAGDAR